MLINAQEPDAFLEGRIIECGSWCNAKRQHILNLLTQCEEFVCKASKCVSCEQSPSRLTPSVVNDQTLENSSQWM